jgi:hypothetical protein
LYGYVRFRRRVVCAVHLTGSARTVAARKL